MVFPLFELPPSPFQFVRHSDKSVTLASQTELHDARHLAVVGKLASQLLIVRDPKKGFYSKNFIVMVGSQARYYNVRAYFGYDRAKDLNYVSDIEVEAIAQTAGKGYSEYRCYRDGGVMFKHNTSITNHIIEQINEVLEATIRLRLGMSSFGVR